MALVAPGTVTVISTVPGLPAGEVAVICVSLRIVKPTAAVLPNCKPVAVRKPDPVIVTLVPPPTGPRFGETPLITGTALGVAGLEAADALPVPMALVAVTRKV